MSATTCVELFCSERQAIPVFVGEFDLSWEQFLSMLTELRAISAQNVKMRFYMDGWAKLFVELPKHRVAAIADRYPKVK